MSEPPRGAPDRPARGSGARLLDPAFLARLERLQLGTRRRLAGQFTGEHRSTRYGTSLDFADYREYHPGDDFRRIDYNLYARLDILLLKLFEAEDDVTLRLLIDTSGSMQGAKLEQAKRLAAALGFVSLISRDVVTLHTFPTERPAPRFLGRGALDPLFAHLAALTADGETNFAAASSHLLGRPGPPGVTIVLSDLLTPDWEQGVSRLPSRGGDLVIVHVLDPEDLQPDVIGDFDLVDRETGQRVAVSLSPASVAEYAKLAQAWVAEVAGRCRRAGAAYAQVLSNADVEDVLVRGWIAEGVLR